MDNRYFWIKDRLKSEKIQVIYCPTAKMIADFFTKPLQGNLFRKLRDVVLGYKHVNELKDNGESTDEERVENNEKVEKEKKEQKTDGEIGIRQIVKMTSEMTSEDSPAVVGKQKTADGKKVTWKDIVTGKGKR